MNDLEYHFPAKEHTLPPEIYKPAPEEGRALHEHAPLPDDLKSSAPELHQDAESVFHAAISKDDAGKHRQKKELLKRMAGLTAGTAVATVTLMNAMPQMPSSSASSSPASAHIFRLCGDAVETDDYVRLSADHGGSLGAVMSTQAYHITDGFCIEFDFYNGNPQESAIAAFIGEGFAISLTAQSPDYTGYDLSSDIYTMGYLGDTGAEIDLYPYNDPSDIGEAHIAILGEDSQHHFDCARCPYYFFDSPEDWHHFAYTYESGSVILSVDGSHIASSYGVLDLTGNESQEYYITISATSFSGFSDNRIERLRINGGNVTYISADAPTPSISNPEPTAKPNDPGTPSDDPSLAEKADSAFPLLGHLAPNEPAPGFGGADIGEEFILEDRQFIYAGSKYANEPVAISGISYDPFSNTLTLNNYSGGILNVNRMGNSFTVRLIGDNALDGLLIWGFHTCGSVTITGDGSLTINQNQLFAGAGIELQGETGEACLMIDSGVTLDVYGYQGNANTPPVPAILIHETNMAQGIYYLAPLKLKGGIRQSRDLSAYYQKLYNGFYDYTVIDPDTNEPSLHVTFSP